MKKVLVKDKCMSRLCCLLGFLALSSLAFIYMLTGAAEPDPYFHLIFKTVLLHALICWTVTALFLAFLLLFVRVESDQAKMDK